MTHKFTAVHIEAWNTVQAALKNYQDLPHASSITDIYEEEYSLNAQIESLTQLFEVQDDETSE